MSLFSRVFFIVAFVLLALAVLDWVIRLFGYTFAWVPYQPGRLSEFAAIMMIFVIAILLRQIRDRLKQ